MPPKPVLALILGVAIMATSCTEGDASSTTSGEATTAVAVETVEWTVTMESGDVIRLVGVLPNGYPTETWLNDELIDRDEGGDFSWNLDKRVPEPVSMHDAMACAELLADSAFWAAGAQDALENSLTDSAYRQLAYAQDALDVARQNGCE